MLSPGLGLGHGTAASFPSSVPKEGGASRGDMLATKVAEIFFFFRQEYLEYCIFIFFFSLRLINWEVF